MRQLPLLFLCGALAACSTSAPKRASGVGFGNDYGAGVSASAAPAPRPVSTSPTTTAIRGGTVTSQTIVGADGRTRTTRTVEIGTPPRQAAASTAPVVSGSVPTYRIDDPRIKGVGYRTSDQTITAIRRAGDSSATSNNARTVPFSAEGISGGLRLVILNGDPFVVLEPASGLALKDRATRARAASAAAAMAGCTSDNRALVHSGWLATTWIIDVSC